jgi:cell fate (sporulation/competence/biofilm development) regulator YlbF (YheA/YmcA/DUF963 family)
MTIFEKTRELGEMIQESEEMKAFKEAEAAQKNDEPTQEQLKEFNLLRINLARDMQNGKISREDAVEKNNAAFDELCQKAPLIREYAQAKKNFDEMVNQINTIINFYITGSTGDCTHDCSTCGGCH